MVRRAKWLVVAATSVLAVAACGDDPKPSTGGSAGDTGEAGSGSPQPPSGAGESQGGSSIEPTPNEGGEGGVSSQGGAGGEVSMVDPTEVRGRLVSYGLGPLYADTWVLIDGKRINVGADGSFSARGVGEKYDLMIFMPDVYLRVYQGLSTREPQLPLRNDALDEGATARSATVRGKLLGGLEPPYGDLTLYQLVSYISDRTRANDTLYDTSSFELEPTWVGQATDTGTIWALQAPYAAGQLPTYSGFGKREVTIADGEIIGSVNGSALTDITLTDPPETIVEGVLTVPDGVEVSSAGINVGPFYDVNPIDAGAFSVVIPSIEDLPVYYTVSFRGADDSAVGSLTRIAPAAGPWALSFAAPPRLSTPTNGATDVDGETIFSWTDVLDETVSTVYLTIGSLGIEIVTAGTAIQLPDFAKVGLRAPKNMPVTWFVTTQGPASTVEEYLSFEHAYYQDAAIETTVHYSQQRTAVTAK